MMKTKKDTSLTAVAVLRNLREDIRKMEWERFSYDGRTLLIAKAKVLKLVADWIEYCAKRT